MSLKQSYFVYVIIVCLCFPALLFAGDLSSKPNSASSLNGIMKQVGGIMLGLYPKIVAKRTLSADEVKVIRSDLSDLEALFFFAEPFIGRKPDTYHISYEFITEYLRELQLVFDTNEVELARRQMYALGEICTSCHTQDSTLRTLFQDIPRNRFSSDLAFAEFSYMTRGYKNAVKYYQRYLRSPAAKTEWEIIQPLQRLVIIYIQVYKQPKALIEILQKFRNLKQHTPETKAEVNHWLEGLNSFAALEDTKSYSMKFSEMMSDVAKYLGPMEAMPQHTSTAANEVAGLWLRGRMFEYLNGNPKRTEIPVLLYWLSVADRTIAYNYYFSLANMYLKQCVLKYPSHPYAQRCFTEYEYYIENTYTVQGEKYPPGISKELHDMRKILKKRRNEPVKPH